MRRITMKLLSLALLLATAGCGKEYANQRLAGDGPEASAAMAMVAALRAAGADLPAVARAQQAADLPPERDASMLSAAQRIAAAQRVELVRADRYGPEVVQVLLRLHRDGQPAQPLALLMTRTGEGYRWLGRP